MPMGVDVIAAVSAERSRHRALALAALLAVASEIALAAPSHAQTLSHGSLGIDHFDLEGGLPGMYITDLALTDDGRLWLIASGQLTSFDGREFETHPLSVPASERGNTIIGIGAGRADTLWVIVGDQLVSYSRGRTETLAQHDELLRDVWQAGDGGLWGWDSEGALRFDGRTITRVLETGSDGGPLLAETPSPDDPHGWSTLHLQDPEGGKTREIARARLTVAASDWPLPHFADRAFTTRLEGDSVAVARFDGTPLFRLGATPKPAPLLTDRRGIVWVTQGTRVAAYGVRGEEVAAFELSAGGRVTVAAEDHEGNVWLGTVTQGLLRVRHRPVQTLGKGAGLTDGQVRKVTPGGGAGLLALEATGTVIRWAPGGVDTLYLPTSPADVAMAAVTDRRGTDWIAHRGRPDNQLRGRLSDGSEVRISTDRDIPQRIIEDPTEDGLLWMVGGSVQRVRPYDPQPIIQEVLANGWGARDLWVEEGGRAWAIGARGLAHITPDGVEEFLAADGHPTASGRAVHRSADGTVWIGRNLEGLVAFRDSTFYEIRATDGLWDDGVSTILEDDGGNLWMSSNLGVHRVSLDDLDAFIEGRIDRVRGTGYSQADGFLNPETSGWSGLRSPDGQLWFPTFGGVAVIDPTAVLAQELTPPRVRMRYVQAGDRRLLPDTALHLARGMRRVDVGFSATLLAGHDGVRYEVQLEGVDADWVDLGDQRQISYGTLPPGRHLFRARAMSGAGVVSEEQAAVTLVVPPFFRETAAFRWLALLSAAAVLALMYRARTRQLRLRETRLRGLVDERTRHLAESQRETEAALATVEAQSRELRTLDEAKSRFFANVSHELRTPLTLVQGPLQDVLDGRLGPTPGPVREQVETVLASGRRLGELVDQLLDVARLESGELRLVKRTHDLAPLLERLSASFGALARRREIDLQATLPTDAVYGRVDVDHLEKVLANLLGNALKFTPSGGRVEWVVEVVEDAADRHLRVRVTDDGPGIPEAEQGRIFERFRQVDDSPQRRHGGTGLGLALVKEIVELHGGEVEVQSQLGRGATFTVRLPIGPVPDEAFSDVGAGAPPDQAADAQPDPLADAQPDPVAGAQLAHDADGRPVHAAAPGSGADPERTESDAERRTVLVVEDNAELRAYLRRHLGDDYRVLEAANGIEGLAIARDVVPDLILCDVMMPEMDGEALCRAVRADPELSFLPVIMVTARASRPSRLSALEGGADDYLIKPFDPQELRLRIRNLFAARQRLEARLRDRGETLPFVGLDLPQEPEGRDFVAQLEEVLRERMSDEDFGVAEMGRALAMSRSTLYRHVDEALGVTPMEVLWRYRLRQAAHWLQETDATVSEVAYSCGFKTVPHFTRRFKERYEATPAVYREANAGGEGDGPDEEGGLD